MLTSVLNLIIGHREAQRTDGKLQLGARHA